MFARGASLVSSWTTYGFLEGVCRYLGSNNVWNRLLLKSPKNEDPVEMLTWRYTRARVCVFARGASLVSSWTTYGFLGGVCRYLGSSNVWNRLLLKSPSNKDPVEMLT